MSTDNAGEVVVKDKIEDKNENKIKNKIKIPIFIAFSDKKRKGLMRALKLRFPQTEFKEKDWHHANLFFYCNDNDEKKNWEKHFNKEENLFASRWMPPIQLQREKAEKKTVCFDFLRRRGKKAKADLLLQEIFKPAPAEDNSNNNEVGIRNWFGRFKKDKEKESGIRGILRTLELIDLFNEKAEVFERERENQQWYA